MTEVITSSRNAGKQGIASTISGRLWRLPEVPGGSGLTPLPGLVNVPVPFPDVSVVNWVSTGIGNQMWTRQVIPVSTGVIRAPPAQRSVLRLLAVRFEGRSAAAIASVGAAQGRDILWPRL